MSSPQPPLKQMVNRRQAVCVKLNLFGGLFHGNRFRPQLESAASFRDLSHLSHKTIGRAKAKPRSSVYGRSELSLQRR
jgi:hypothetical protein